MITVYSKKQPSVARGLWKLLRFYYVLLININFMKYVVIYELNNNHNKFPYCL